MTECFFADIAEITKLSSEGHYNIACTKYFIATHGQEPGRMFMHPNQYYAESRKILTDSNTDEAKGKNANVI